MALLIGMDEAGYGPNLGPLVVGATVWEVPGDPRCIDLWQEFAGIVAPSAPTCGSHIQIADSKLVFTPARGLANLEAGVLAALSIWRRQALLPDDSEAHNGSNGLPVSIRDLVRQIAVRPPEELDAEPWFAAADHPLAALESKQLADCWHDRCCDRNIRLRAICADVVLTQRFNEHARRHNSKGQALTEISLHLLRHVWQLCDADAHDAVLVIADKHGGRNRYHDFLPIAFGERFIRCHNESMEQSRYGIGSAEVRFETKSERHLPVALASMVCKYVRELAMILFNRFWTERQPGLKSTAGYPVDARRFKCQIADLQHHLGISDEILWRER